MTSSWYALADLGNADQIVESYTERQQLLRTNKTINVHFDDKFESCRLTAIRFSDRTHKITTDDHHYFSEERLEQHLAKSDGFEIQALSIR
ncbi:hypothetical protein QW180_05945 [Vibrio sinaloensis]|nr:hypothetical protein [Vibrio sinaloensis]